MISFFAYHSRYTCVPVSVGRLGPPFQLNLTAVIVYLPALDDKEKNYISGGYLQFMGGPILNLDKVSCCNGFGAVQYLQYYRHIKLNDRWSQIQEIGRHPK